MVSLAQRALWGAIWTISSSIASRFVGVLGTLVLTHYLAPEVVGEVAAAFLLVTTARHLSTFGFGQFIVATPGLAPTQVFQITVLNSGFAAVGLALAWLLAEPLSPLFKAPGLVDYIPGLILAGAIERIGIVPERLLARDMRFKIVSVARAVAELAYAATSVGLVAWAEWGGQAIVAGNVVRACITTGAYVLAMHPREWLSPGSLRQTFISDLFHFGTPLWVSTNAHFAARSWDNLLFSAYFGPAAMGQYNLAYNLASIPSIHIGEHIGDVLLPSFARMPELDDKRRALIRASGLMALIIFPLAVGLGAVADTLVAWLFTPEWQRVAPFLLLLSALSIVRPISWIINSYLQARRLTRWLMILGLIKVTLLLGCMALLGLLGDIWACAGVCLAFTLDAWLQMLVVSRKDQVSMRAMLKSMAGPLFACGPLVAAVFAARTLGLPPGLDLAAETLAGAIAYTGAAAVFARPILSDLVRLLRSSMQR